MSNYSNIVFGLTVLMGLTFLSAYSAPTGLEASLQSTVEHNCTDYKETIKIMCNTVFYLDLVNSNDSAVELENMSNYLQAILTAYEESLFPKFDCLCDIENLDVFREFCVERFVQSSSCN